MTPRHKFKHLLQKKIYDTQAQNQTFFASVYFPSVPSNLRYFALHCVNVKYKQTQKPF